MSETPLAALSSLEKGSRRVRVVNRFLAVRRAPGRPSRVVPPGVYPFAPLALPVRNASTSFK